jgi:hypothetical protein
MLGTWSSHLTAGEGLETATWRDRARRSSGRSQQTCSLEAATGVRIVRVAPLDRELGPALDHVQLATCRTVAVRPLHRRCVVWEGPTDHTATSLLEDTHDRDDPTARSDAQDVLRQLLAGGPRPATVVLAETRAAGIGLRTLRRASRALGIRPRKAGLGGWLWELPAAHA